MSRVKKTHRETIELLTNKGVPHSDFNDRSGKPYYIVEKRDDQCPPGQAEKFYLWGYMFSPDGTLHHTWGTPPT